MLRNWIRRFANLPLSARPILSGSQRKETLFQPTVETLEHRIVPARNLAIGNFAGSISINSATASGTTTFQATADNAQLDIDDIRNALLAGNNVSITNGATGTQTGTITWQAGADLDFNGISANRSLTVATDATSLAGASFTLSSAILDSVAGGAFLNVTFNARDGVILSGAGADVTTAGSLNVNADSNTDGTGTYTQDNAGSVVSAGSFAIVAADINLLGSLAGTSSNSQLIPSTSTATVGVEGAGSFNLTDAELDRISLGAGSALLVGSSGTSGTLNLATTGALTQSTSIQFQTGGTIAVGANNVTMTTYLSLVADQDNNGSGAITSAGGLITSSQLYLSAATGITLNTDAAFLSITNRTSGAISITEANNVQLFSFPISNTGGGAITITSGGVVTVTEAITAGGGGNITLSARDGVTFSGANADVTTTGTFTVNADNNADGTGTYTQNNAGSAVGSGAVSITAADVNLVGTINAGSATVSFITSSSGRTIDLGTNTAGKFSLTDTELDLVTASAIRVGAAGAGAVTVSAAVSAGATSTLHLITGAGIMQTGSGALTQNSLAIEAGGQVDLSTNANEMTNLAATTSAGAIVYNDVTGFNVTTVDGVAGATSATFSVQLTANAGDVRVFDTAAANDINANGGGVQIILNGNEAKLTVDAGAVVRGQGLDFRADKMALAGTLTSTGTVVLKPNAGKAINLGSAVDTTANTLELSDAELDKVTAPSLEIGTSFGPLAITVSAPISFGGAGTLFLITPVAVNINAALSTSSGAGVTVLNGGTLTVSSPLTLDGAFSQGGTGAVSLGAGIATTNDTITFAKAVTLTGNVTLNAGTATVSLSDNLTVGASTLTLTAGASTSLGAATTLAGGTIAAANGVTVGGSGSLTGAGTVSGAVTIQNGGSFSPGSAGPAQVSTGALTLATGATFTVELNGTAPGSGYDQVQVTGAVNLGGATLSVSRGFMPASGAPFVLIANDGGDAVTGTFAGLAEGAALNVSGRDFTISYHGGDGNDVVLTAAPLTFTWDGGGVDNKWSTVANWVGDDVAPSAGDILVFAGTTRLSNTNDFAANTTFHSIVLSGPGNFSLSGNAVTLNGGGTVINSTAGSNSIFFDITLTAASTFSDAGAFLSLFGNVNNGGNLLTINAANTGGETMLNGVISGAGGLTKTGSQQLRLRGASTYAGPTTISQGNVIVDQVGTLGSSAAGTTVASGASLGLDVASGAEALTLGGNLTFFRNIVHSGTITLTANNLSFKSYATATFAGAIGDGGNGYGLSFDGAFVLSGANAYTGPTQLTAGATLQLGNAGVIADASAVTVPATATLDLNNFNETIGSLAGAGNVTLGSGTLTAGGDNTSTTFSGILSGTGGLTKQGSGTLTLSNANTYTGSTTVSGGRLVASHATALGTAAGSTTVNAGATLEIAVTATLAEPFVLNGGTFRNSSSISPTLTGGLQLAANSFINTGFSGQITVDSVVSGAGGFTLDGNSGGGGLRLKQANTFAGTVIVNANTMLLVENLGTLGSAAGGTQLTSGAVLWLAGVTVTGESLSLTSALLLGSGTAAWNGTVSLTGANDFSPQGGAFTVGGNISGAGSLNLDSTGSLTLGGVNTYTGATSILNGTLRVAGGAALPDAAPVVLGNSSSAVLNLNGSSEVIGSLSGGEASGGSVLLGGGTLTTGGDNSSTIYSGVISGTGGLVKQGTGTFTLAASHTYTGTTTVSNGTLRVNGSLASPVTVQNGGTLGGSGTVAALTVNNGGKVAPGTGTGILTAAATSFATGSQFAVDINGTTPGSQYDRLVVRGLSLGNGTLAINLLSAPTPDSTYRIIDNLGTQPVIGTYLGLPELAFVQVGADSFQITYQGGDGNDIELTNSIPPRISFATADQTVAEENAGVITVTATLQQPLSLPLQVPLTIQGGGTATAGKDFNLLTTTLSFLPGQTTASASIEIVNDPSDENATETFTVALSSATGAIVGPVGTNTITIQDDDPAPIVSFASSSQTVNEGAMTTVEVILSAASALNVTVPFTFSTNSATAGDYTMAGSVFIPAGTTKVSTTLTIVDDPTGERAELLQIGMGTPTNATRSVDPAKINHVVTIPQNDTPSVSFVLGSQTKAENGGTVQIEVKLSNASVDPVTVPYTISGNASSSDRTVTPASPLVFSPGQTSKMIAVAIENDSLDEGNETVQLDLGTPTGALLGATRRHVLTIEDNDTAYLNFTTSSQSVWEDHGTVAATVQLSTPSATDRSFRLYVSGATASSGYATRGSGRDFTVNSPDVVNSSGYITATIPAGQTTPKTFVFSINNDSANEPSEKISLSLTDAAGNTGKAHLIGTVSGQTITIKDDDPFVTIDATTSTGAATSTTSVTEASTSLYFKIYLSAPTNKAVTVPFKFGSTSSSSYGTASVNSDFQLPNISQVTIPADSTSSGNVSFSVLEDSRDEYDETIIVKLGSPTDGAGDGAQLPSGGASLEYTIKDDDAAPSVSFLTTATVSMGEANKSRTIYIELSRSSAKDVYVSLTFDGTARQNTDYTATGLDSIGRLKIPAGNTSASITITTRDDSSDEGTETIIPRMTGATNASLPSSTSSRKRTINIDDDDHLTIIIESGSVTYTLPTVPQPAPAPGYIPPTIAGQVNAGDNAYNSGGAYIPNNSGLAIDQGPLGVTQADFINVVIGSQGYLDGSTAFFDANFNGVQDFLDLNNNGIQEDGEPTEPGTFTQLDGGFSLVIGTEFDRNQDSLITASEGRWVVSGGVDTSTGVSWRYPLAAPLGYFTVSPLSTVVENLVRLQGFDLASAEQRLLDAFGLQGVSLPQLNVLRSMALGDPNAASTYAATVRLSNAVLQIGDLFAGTPGAPGLTYFTEQLFADLAARIAAPGSTLDLSSAPIIGDVINGLTVTTGVTFGFDPDTQQASIDAVVNAATDVIVAGNQAIDAVPNTADVAYATALVKVKKVMQGGAAPALHTAMGDAAPLTALAAVVTEYTQPNLDAKFAAATVGSILPPTIQVLHTTVQEGNNGTTVLDFLVHLHGAHDDPASVVFTTLNDVASVIDGDYVAQSGTLTWLPTDAADKHVLVTVNSDTVFENDESLMLFLSNATNAVIVRSTGYGYILNDDALNVTLPAGGPNTVNLDLSAESFGMLQNGQAVYDGYLTNPLAATFVGQDNANDTLVLEFSHGTIRADAITFQGGAGSGTDAVRVESGDFASITHPLGGGTTVLTSGDSAAAVNLAWAGVEAFTFNVGGVRNLTLQLPAGVTSAILEDADPTDADPGLAGKMQLRSATGAFPTVVFTAPSQGLVISGSNGTDSVTIASTDPAFTGTVLTLGPASAPRVEGTAITFNGQATHFQPGALTVGWAVYKDGAATPLTTGGNTTSYSFTPPDNGSYRITFQASDANGVVAQDETTITVGNQVPSAVLSGPDSVTEGAASAVITISGQTDPSTADALAGFTYSFDLDGDNVFEIVNSSTPSATVSGSRFTDGPSSVTVNGRITDKDGGFRDLSLVISVTNAAPSGLAYNFAPATPLEGQTATISGSFSDPGSLDSHTVIFSWNDGTAATVVNLAAGVTTFSSSHAFADNGTIPVVVTVLDNDGGQVGATQNVTVSNVAPTINTFTVPGTGLEGTPVTLVADSTDPAGSNDPLTFSWTVTKNGDPFTTGTGATFSFTPDDNGSYGVSLTVSDGDTGTASQSATVTVGNANPTITGFTVPGTGLEGASVTVTATATDPAGSNDPLTFSWTVTKNGDPFTTGTGATFSFTPDDNDSYGVSLTVSDGDTGTASQSAIVTVGNANPAITVFTVPSVGAAQTALTVSATATDPAGSNDVLTVSWTVTRNGANFASGSGNSFGFTPDIQGSYVVAVVVSDGEGGTASQTAIVSVAAPATAIGDVLSVPEDSLATALNVLANDLGSSLVITGVTQGGNGTVATTGGGTGLTYKPGTDFTGVDTFTYTITDSNNHTSTATVIVAITPVNDGPVAQAASFNATEDTLLSGSLASRASDVDNFALTFAVVANPTHGSLTLNDDGSFTYQPAANYNGPDSFTYQAGDGTLTSNTATVTLTVSAVNDAPAAQNKTAGTAEDTALVDSVGATDVDGPALTFSVVANPAHGALTLNPDGSFIYTPATDYNGPDSFTFQASDGTAASNIAAASLTVAAVNDAPTLTAPAGATLVVNGSRSLAGVTISDPDADAGPLQVTVSALVGSLSLGGTTGLSFTVGTGTANGIMTFTGTLASINNALAGLSYQGQPDSVAADTVTLQVSDQGNSGAGGPLTDSKGIVINPNAGTAQLLSDPFKAGTVALVITGTAGNDTLAVSPSGTSTTTFVVTINGVPQTVAGVTGRLLVFGADGNDKITLTSTVKKQTFLAGGNGNDTITGGAGIDFLSGGAGNDTINGGAGKDRLVEAGDANMTLLAGTTALNGSLIGLGTDVLVKNTVETAQLTGGASANTLDASTWNLGAVTLLGGGGDDVLKGGTKNSLILGGDGNDTLTGGLGKDVLIGGLGLDVLNGGAGEDLLIGGTTSHDNVQAELDAVMLEWTSTSPYLTRVGHLLGTITKGKNGAVLLKNTTVFTDGLANSLTGIANLDWFFKGVADLIADQNNGGTETVTSVP